MMVWLLSIDVYLVSVMERVTSIIELIYEIVHNDWIRDQMDLVMYYNHSTYRNMWDLSTIFSGGMMCFSDGSNEISWCGTSVI